MTIEEYLSELRANLDVGPLRKRRILREIEAHLLDAVHEARIAGASRQEAERLAIERFGPVEALVSRFSEPSPRRLRQFAASFASLAALAGLLATTLTFALTSERKSPTTAEDAAKRPHSTGQGASTSTITVQAKDQFGNNLTSSGGTVTLSTTKSTLGAVTDNNNGTYRVTFSEAVTGVDATGRFPPGRWKEGRLKKDRSREGAFSFFGLGAGPSIGA